MLDFEEFKRRYQKVPVEEYPNRVREAVPNPLLSVHLITYNHAEYIQKAIESVLMQDVDFPMEIVLGDDDSSDGTREICIEYAEQHPDLIRLQLHHRENNHSLHGRPTHLFQYWYNTFTLRGKYFAVLSGDDYWTDRRKIKSQTKFLESNKNFSLTFHDAKVVNKDDEVTENSMLPNHNKKDFSKKGLKKSPFLVAGSILGRNVFGEIPKEVLSTLSEDRMITSILGECGRGKYIDGVKMAYRIRKESVWHRMSRIGRIEEKLNYLNCLIEIHSKKSSREVNNSLKLKRNDLLKIKIKSYFQERDFNDAFLECIKCIPIMIVEGNCEVLSYTSRVLALRLLRNLKDRILGRLKIKVK